MEHNDAKNKVVGTTCGLKSEKCKPCIASKLMVVFLIGYALLQFFGS